MSHKQKMFPCHHCGGEHPIGGPNPCHLLIEELNTVQEETRKVSEKFFNLTARAGRLLLQAKSQCKHGEWLPWLDAHFVGNARTAEFYMQDARKDSHGRTAKS